MRLPTLIAVAALSTALCGCPPTSSTVRRDEAAPVARAERPASASGSGAEVGPALVQLDRQWLLELPAGPILWILDEGIEVQAAGGKRRLLVPLEAGLIDVGERRDGGPLITRLHEELQSWPEVPGPRPALALGFGASLPYATVAQVLYTVGMSGTSRLLLVMRGQHGLGGARRHRIHAALVRQPAERNHHRAEPPRR